MTQSNFDVFLETYEVLIMGEEIPDQTLLTTAQSTINLYARGRAKSISPLIRATCKRLNIPTNKLSIQKFLNS